MTLSMDEYSKPKVVAEIGCNHKGDIDIAKELINLAKEAKVDYAKFQKRNNKELLTEDQYNQPHPVAYNAYGNTYGAHREFLELSIAQHKELKAYCDNIGIGYATSVWDLASAKEIITLKPDYIKVPSACNTNTALIEYLANSYDGQIHISTGMTTHAEEAKFMQTLSCIAPKRIVLYACTSGYPVAFPDVSLLEINRLGKAYGGQVASIGFSGHHLGIAIDVAAYTLGAAWIERHFTKDRTWKGTDHAASLEYGGLAKLVRNLKATHESLTYKPQEILEIEVAQREKLKYRTL